MTDRVPLTDRPAGVIDRDALAARFSAAWAELAAIGTDGDGGYLRPTCGKADLELRAWFRHQAAERGLTLDEDRNGNLWAWWGEPAPGAIVTGSHLDSVPHGGAFDGPLGIVSAFLALDEIRLRNAAPVRLIAVVDFAEEEGSRFGVACLGSRLLTGAVAPERARSLRDRDGASLADALAGAGLDPGAIGPDPERVGAIGAFVELHVEQGRALADLGAPVAVGTGIWPHGRWRFGFLGEANHAGTTPIDGRRDPVVPLAGCVLAARLAARRHGGVATFGRLEVRPNATNAVAGEAAGWLDARAPEVSRLRALVGEVSVRARELAEVHGVECAVEEESLTPAVAFDGALVEQLAAVLAGAPRLATAAGHDAGVLAAVVPSAMLFVRNPTGASHTPAETASLSDCVAGVVALGCVLEHLACR